MAVRQVLILNKKIIQDSIDFILSIYDIKADIKIEGKTVDDFSIILCSKDFYEKNRCIEISHELTIKNCIDDTVVLDPINTIKEINSVYTNITDVLERNNDYYFVYN